MPTDTTEQTWDFGRRAEYETGPWSSEPDKVQWIDPTTDLDCLILRNGSGALCGYVGVPKAHPWHGKGYSECLAGCPDDDDDCYEHSPDHRVSVHGGLTFAAKCAEGRGDDAICHVPAPGRDGDVWWFGFDTAHSGDYPPAYASKRYSSSLWNDGVYRDMPYVKAECARLAEQLTAVSA